MKDLSRRTADFTDSVIRRMTRISNRYGAVNLSQGFPDFDPPKALLDRLAQGRPMEHGIHLVETVDDAAEVLLGS